MDTEYFERFPYRPMTTETRKELQSGSTGASACQDGRPPYSSQVLLLCKFSRPTWFGLIGLEIGGILSNFSKHMTLWENEEVE